MKIFPIIVNKDFSMPYFQRGRDHFLTYCLDGSISGRNSGFYVPPVIFFDELRFYIKEKDKEYNLHDYIKKVEIGVSETTHYFEFKDKKIKLTYFVPEDFAGLQIFIKANKKIDLLFDPKFSFNYVWRENPIKKFSIFEKDNCIYARSDFDTKIWCMFKANKPLKLIKDKIFIKGLKLRINFTTSVMSKHDLERHMSRLLQGKNQRLRKLKKYGGRIFDSVEFKCDDEELNKAFIFAKHNLRLLRHHQHDLGRGYFAGLPNLTEYYGRDSFWSIPGILAIGDFDCVKSMLNIFSRYQSTYKTETKKFGEVPNEIWLTGEPNYYGIDSTILFIYAMYHYYLWTGDKEYIKAIFDIIKKAVECNTGSAKDYLIRHGKEGFVKGVTWMDTYSRSQTGVDVQALFVKSMKCGAFLAKVAGEKKLAKQWSDYSKKAKEKLKLFWKKDWFIDHLHKDKSFTNEITINPFVLLLLGLTDKKKAKLCFKKAEETGLIAEGGVRSRAKDSKGYDPASYHKGGSWPLLNGWAALAFFRYGETERAYNILKKQLKLYSMFVPGFAPEWIHGKKFTVSKINIGAGKTRMPAWNQLWSSSLFLQAIIEELCGVKPDPLNKKINIKPQLPKGINKIELKNLRVFDKMVDVKIERKKGRIIVNKKIRKCEV